MILYSVTNLLHVSCKFHQNNLVKGKSQETLFTCLDISIKLGRSCQLGVGISPELKFTAYGPAIGCKILSLFLKVPYGVKSELGLDCFWTGKI